VLQQNLTLHNVATSSLSMRISRVSPAIITCLVCYLRSSREVHGLLLSVPYNSTHYRPTQVSTPVPTLVSTPMAITQALIK